MKLRTALTASLALASTLPAFAAPETYVIDPDHTNVTFELRHFKTSTIRARFDKKSGTITIDPVAKTGSADITIDLTSIDSNVAMFDKTAKGANIFNTERYPEAMFAARQFRFDGDKVTQVSGDLTMVGQTHPVTLNATNYNCYQSPVAKKSICGGDFETTIARSQWNINFGTPFLSDEIKLLIQIEAFKQ